MKENTFDLKKRYFEEGKTLSYDFRISQLRKLRDTIEKYEGEILAALQADLNKPEFEAYTSEIGLVYSEINSALKNLRKWMKKRRVATPMFLQPGRSYAQASPKGIVLIISPWNYPFSLAISPLIGAISAGNCIILKPSSKSRHTSNIIEKIVKEAFTDNYISMVEGGSEEVNLLLEAHRFDHIFFTGSSSVGKEIMGKAAAKLSPVTLELGGKSPGIVWRDANIDHAAKTIAWAKFYNGGQTCISPDYLLIHPEVKDEFIGKLKKYLDKFYGEKKMSSIIDEKAFDRLEGLVDKDKLIFGGEFNREELYISPTLLDKVSLEDEIMKEEIFGPILPLLDADKVEDIRRIVDENPYPLGLYLFTEDKELERYIIENIAFGGASINDAISHYVNKNLPFGGIGFSGMGSYHGRQTFEEFSHIKGIFKGSSRFALDLKFPPYNEKKLNIAKIFLR